MRDGSTDEFRAIRMPSPHNFARDISPLHHNQSPLPEDSGEIPPFLSVRTGDEYTELNDTPPIPKEARLQERRTRTIEDDEPLESIENFFDQEAIATARQQALRASEINEFHRSLPIDQWADLSQEIYLEPDNCTTLAIEFNVKINPDGTLPRGGVFGLFDKNKKRFEMLLKTNPDFKSRYEAAVNLFHHQPKPRSKDRMPRTAMVAGALVGGAVAGAFAHSQESQAHDQMQSNIDEMAQRLSNESAPSSVDSPFVDFEMHGEKGLDAQEANLEAVVDFQLGDTVPAKYLQGFENLTNNSKNTVAKLNRATTVEAFRDSNGKDFLTVSFEGVPQRIYKIVNGKVDAMTKGEVISVKTAPNKEALKNLLGDPNESVIEDVLKRAGKNPDSRAHQKSLTEETPRTQTERPISKTSSLADETTTPPSNENNTQDVKATLKEIRKNTEAVREQAEDDSDALADMLPQTSSRTTIFDKYEQSASGKKIEPKVPKREETAEKTVTITNAGRTGNFYDAIVRQVANFNNLDIKTGVGLKEAQKLTDAVLKKEMKTNPDFLKQAVSKEYMKLYKSHGITKIPFRSVKEALQDPENTGKASITLRVH